MAAAGLAVAAHQHIVRCIQKQDFVRSFLLVQLLQCLLDLLPRAAAAHIHGQRHPFQLALARFRKGSDAGQQPRRDIVDAEKADVF